jgi:hypothetical protein
MRRTANGAAWATRAACTLAVTASAGCGIFLVDHEANSRRFCDRSAELLEPAAVDEGRVFTEDQAKYLSDQLSKNMRFAEDATRDLRRRARDLADSYDDARELAGVDDPAADEVDELYAELREHREQVRTTCAEVLQDQEGDPT